MPVALVTNIITPYRAPLYQLLAQRYDVEVLCFGGGQSYVPAWFGELDAQLAAAPFPARRLDGPRAALRLGSRYRAAIAPVAGGPMLPATYLAMRARKRPFVLWGSVWSHPRGSAKAALAFPLVRHVYRHADAVVTYGEHVSRYIARYRGRDDDVTVAPQSVEADLFGRAVSAAEVAAFRRTHDLPESGPLVLYVGRLVPEKGIEQLLAAWPAVARAHRDATLVAIGDGELASRVAAADDSAGRARGTAARGGVRLLGALEREAMPVAYAAASVVAVPSIPTAHFREPWGLVCNEAMHQGTPVVATDAVGAAAGGLVRDGETGLVVPAGDAAALAEAITRLLADNATYPPAGRDARPAGGQLTLAARLGAAGHEAVAAHTYEAMADAFGRALAQAGAI